MGVSVRFTATETPSRTFWSNGYAWGTFAQTPTRDRIEVDLAVLHGTLRVDRLLLEGAGEVRFD